MRITGWPSYWNEADGLLPVETQEVDLRATPSELRALAQFLTIAADELEAAQLRGEDYRSSLDFSDDKPQPPTPIVFEVIGEVECSGRLLERSRSRLAASGRERMSRRGVMNLR